MKYISILFIALIFFSCTNSPPQVIETDDYELIIPENPKAVLILFPGFGGNAERIKQESKIPQEAVDNNIVVLLFNTYNYHLFLTYNEKDALENIISNTLKTHHLESESVFLGGFSSGGNVTLLMADRLNAKGLFIIDSPVDLANFYSRCQNIVQNNDEEVIEESKYFLKYFNSNFGNPTEDISMYEEYSPYTSITNFTYNIPFSKNTATRLYTEPDLKYYKKKFNDIQFSDLNTFSIQKMHNSLLESGYQNIEYIETKNKGYRANGKRTPHSWSIVDAKEIVGWIFKNN